MNVTEFREKVKPGATLLVAGQSYTVEQVVTFRMDDGSENIKCFLIDEHVFADDLAQNSYFLGKKVETPYVEPFPPRVSFEGKELEFLYTAHETAIASVGKEIYKNGESEWFWDYQAEDGSYLSIGTEDSTRERWDCFGKIIQPDEVQFKE